MTLTSRETVELNPQAHSSRRLCREPGTSRG
jgi:hypothetical protein